MQDEHEDLRAANFRTTPLDGRSHASAGRGCRRRRSFSPHGDLDVDRNLRHEKFDAYALARDVARHVRAAQLPRGDADLKDQARRAAQSCCLNPAEGCYREGKDRLHFFRVAAGSAAEACAVLDLVNIEGVADIQARRRRVVAMLCKLR